MKKLLSVLLIFALCLSLAACGVTAAAADKDKDDDGAEDAVELILSDDTGSVTVTEAGTYHVTGSLSDGQIVVDAKDAKVTLILDGVDITCRGSAAVYVAEADKVVLSLAAGSENSLTSLGEFAGSADEGIDAAVFGRDDITIKGEGSLTVASEYGHGIVSKDDLKIKGGTVSVTAAKKGLSANDDLEISGGTVTVKSGADALHAENADDASLGNILIEGGEIVLTGGGDGMDASGTVTIEGGSVSISAADDGIHSDATLTVSGGEVLVAKSYEGLEAKVIQISGGTVDVTASDDGLNATSGGSSSSGWGRGGGFAAQSGVEIFISGGTVTVDAGGDGVDSNGELTITGGIVYVSGPTNSGNGALDYNGSSSITGGVVVAAGSVGMAESLTAAGSQGVILYTLSSAQSGGSAVTLTDSSGKTLASFTPAKNYQSVVVSAPGLTSGGTYTLQCGSVSESITLSSLNWSNGGGMGGFGGQMPGGMGGFDGQTPGAGDFGGQTPGGPGGGGFSGQTPGGGFGGGPSGFGGWSDPGESV